MKNIKSESWLLLQRTVHFGDTDGAGVVHFHQLLRWCHEGWEESLIKYGISAVSIFPCQSNQKDPPKILLPIIHCEADFKSPVQVGQMLQLKISPTRLTPNCFQVETKFIFEDYLVAIGLIRHLSINALTRKKCLMPEEVEKWIEASMLTKQPQPIEEE